MPPPQYPPSNIPPPIPPNAAPPCPTLPHPAPPCPTLPHRTPHPAPPYPPPLDPPPPTPLPGKPLLAPSPTIAAYRHTVRTSSTAYLMDRTSESQIRHSFPFVTLPICPH